jgi:hypothetical protein
MSAITRSRVRAWRRVMDIHELFTAARPAWPNELLERVIRPARRECLDHPIVCSASRRPAADDPVLPPRRPVAPAPVTAVGRDRQK